jgi:hypothetical protein
MKPKEQRGCRGSYRGRDSFKEQADVLFAIGRYLALADEIMRARDYLRRAMKLDTNLRTEFLDDSAFDAVWDSF